MATDSGSICFVLNSLNLGGIGRNALNLAEELDRRGQPVDLFLVRREGVYLSQVPPSVRVFEGARTARMSMWTLTRYARTERPAALISWNSNIHVLATLAARLSGGETKVICTACTSLTHDTPTKTAYRRLLVRLGNFACRAADAVVAMSAGVGDDVAAHTGIARDRIHVIYNAVATPGLLEQAKRGVDCEYLNAGEYPVIIAAGRLTKQKDFPTLIRAFAAVRRAVSTSRLVILGDGEERDRLHQLVQELDLESSVTFKGYVADPAAYVSKASVFVLSSAWEGFGNVVAEALAVGTPVVSTDCPSGPAEILDHGRYGRLVRVGDATALADAIVETLQSPPDRLMLQERAQAFSAENVADQWLDLIRSRERVGQSSAA